MTRQVQLRRGTTTEHSTFTGANGEVTIDTTKKTAVVHDGATAGGIPLAKESALHTQNTDTGTNANAFAIGDGTAGNKVITANNADVNKPTLRYNDTTNKWEYSNDGETYQAIGSVEESDLHTQNTDTGTNANTFTIGDGTAGNKIIQVDNGDANKPNLRYNDTTNKWEYSNDGTTWTDIGTGSGGGGEDTSSTLRIYKGTLTATNLTLYTATANMLINFITLTNKTNENVTVTLKLAGTEVIYNYLVLANTQTSIPIHQILLNTELIEGLASSASAINLYISGTPLPAGYTRLCKGTLTASNATLATMTANSKIKSLILCNKTSGDVTFTIKLAGTEIFYTYTILGYDVLVEEFDHVILNTELIEGSASLASAINYYISGCGVS